MLLNTPLLKPNPHPTKEVFSHYKVPLFSVAKYIDRTYNHTCAVLRGFNTATPEIDAKLYRLANEIKNKYQKNNGGQL